MATYMIVILSVCYLCKLAEDADYVESIKVNEEKVIHTSDAKYLYVAAAGILILVSGLRYRVGTDYWTYYSGYSRYIEKLPESIRNFQSPGIGILSYIGKKFYDDGASLIFLSALLTIGLMLIVIYNHTDRLLMATFLYITMGCWHSSFNGIKQHLAAAVLLCGIDALKEENRVRWLIIVLLASLFHRSAIVMAVLCILVYRKINRNNLMIIMFITVIAIFFYNFSFNRILSIANYIMDKDYNPIGGYTAHAVNRLRVIAAAIPSLLFYYVYKDKDDITDAEIFYVNITLIHAGICILTMNSALLYRLGSYTMSFQVLAITELLKGISDNNKKLITAGILTIYFIMWCYELSHSSSLIPFRFIWNR